MTAHKFTDMFGVEVTEYRFKPNEAQGYASNPGGGPPGQTCKTCEHRVRLTANSKKFYKCGKNKVNWTRSIRTDIVLKTPACRLWEQSLSAVPRNGNLR